MKNIFKNLFRIFYAVIVFYAANMYTLGKTGGFAVALWIPVVAFVFINIVPSLFCFNVRTFKLKNCAFGCELLYIFLMSVSASVIYLLLGIFGMFGVGNIFDEPKFWLIGIVICVVVEAVVFWNGMVRLYISSSQLGVKWRVIGGLCGMIPIANLIVLRKMLKIVREEVTYENEKILLDESRKSEELCKTKYPLLMVHGVFFRDFRYFNYWGRIPDTLKANGATIYYGNHQSAATVSECAKELDERIKSIVKETGCEKVNVIAHSKGGLDMRYALSKFDTADYVATLTTINTPHRGCEFADYLLSKIPPVQQSMVADAYNGALKKLGDSNPDFIGAVTDLTASACEKRNEEIQDNPKVYYQSVGSKLNVASSGRFPLNFTHSLVKYFDGDNDGLVGEKSFEWGSHYTFLKSDGQRGISHGDMIDLNRENFKGFDVREFYVNLVSDLKKQGY